MSSETKYLVMEELIGVPAAAIEKAEEQASRIIQMVRGEGQYAPTITQEELDRRFLHGMSTNQLLAELTVSALNACDSLPEPTKWQPDSLQESTAYKSLSCSKETLDKINKSGLLDPAGDYSANSHPKQPAYKPPAPDENITGEDIAFLKDKGHTWPEIAVTTGLTQDKARHLYRKWQKKQNADVLYEPGAEEAAAEAQMADAVLKSANQNERGPSPDEQINRLITTMDSQNALDIEILQAVRRQFPGVSMTVADIRERRQKA